MTATQRRKIIDQGIGAVDLWEASPYRLIDDGPATEQIVDALFPRDSLLCCARTSATAYTAPREAWHDLAGMQFIVPSCMTAMRGLTQSGESSARCLDNTGPRRFLVIEQNQGSTNEQAAVLLHLAQHAPLAMVVHSGGKSLDGWFSCRSATEADQQRLFDYAVKLGANPATWPRCQMVRMPEGRRGDGARQPVLFLNPEVIP